MTAPVLLIEDTPSLQTLYRAVLRGAGHTVTVAGTAAEGMAAFRATPPAVVLLDLVLPDRDGLALMRDLLALAPQAAVIVITANASINRAVEAMRAGAHDFLVKPIDEQRMRDAVRNALARTGRADDALPPPEGAPAGFLGSSAAMRDIYGRIGSVARSMATVFITGESGTGKELCAQAIHDLSARAGGPFVPLNCGAIPPDLLESEVFGHLRGSFPGAIADKTGAAAAADGGTLFLDEVCEMDMALQTKLLRFLQTSTIHPVGAARPRKVNVRIICATNRDPMAAVRRGEFREDLYYRLYVVPIHMPPLRARGEDVIEIAEAALRRFARAEGRDFAALDEEVRTVFRALPWPGNVRQLLNVLWNVVLLQDGTTVTLPMLPAEALAQAPGHGPAGLPATAAQGNAGATGDAGAEPADTGPLGGLVGRPLAEIERLVIEATLARFDGSVPRAARVLAVSPSTLYRKIEGWARGGEAADHRDAGHGGLGHGGARPGGAGESADASGGPERGGSARGKTPAPGGRGPASRPSRR